MPPNDEEGMTQRDREVAELIAQTVMARILNAVQDEKVADAVLDTWGGRIDRVIGRALRRLGFSVLIALIVIGAAKFSLLDMLADFIKGK